MASISSVISTVKSFISSKYLSLTGGTMTGAIKTSSTDFIVKNVDTGHLTFVGGTAWNKGGALLLCGMSESGKEGHFELVAHNGSTGKTLLGKPDGSLTWVGNNVVCVSTWRSGDNWYRKYSDGWIEQGGYFNCSANGTTVTFHKAFSNTNYYLDGNASQSTAGARFTSFYNRTTTNAACYTGDDSSFNAGYVYWYASGY